MKKEVILSACLASLMLAGCASENGATGSSSSTPREQPPAKFLNRNFCQVAESQDSPVYNETHCFNFMSNGTYFATAVVRNEGGTGGEVKSSDTQSWTYEKGVFKVKYPAVGDREEMQIGKTLESVVTTQELVNGSVLQMALKNRATDCVQMSYTANPRVKRTYCAVLYRELGLNSAANAPVVDPEAVASLAYVEEEKRRIEATTPADPALTRAVIERHQGEDSSVVPPEKDGGVVTGDGDTADSGSALDRLMAFVRESFGGSSAHPDDHVELPSQGSVQRADIQ